MCCHDLGQNDPGWIIFLQSWGFFRDTSHVGAVYLTDYICGLVIWVFGILFAAIQTARQIQMAYRRD